MKLRDRDNNRARLDREIAEKRLKEKRERERERERER